MPIEAWSLPAQDVPETIPSSLSPTSTMAGPLFLGLDLSTQQIKAVLITEDSTVVHESAVAFDDDLPHHGTKSGAVHGPGNGEVTSPGNLR
jgi:xylulokinase